MADIQKGVACAWGIKTTVGNVNGAAYATGFLRFNSQNLTIDGDTVEHRNPVNGDVEGITHFNKKMTLECVLYPSAASKADANTALTLIPQKGGVINLIDTVNTLIGAATPGKSWDVLSASINGSADDPKWTVNLTLQRFEDGMPDNADYTAIT